MERVTGRVASPDVGEELAGEVGSVDGRGLRLNKEGGDGRTEFGPGDWAWSGELESMVGRVRGDSRRVGRGVCGGWSRDVAQRWQGNF